jgi:hypothetical protein
MTSNSIPRGIHGPDACLDEARGGQAGLFVEFAVAQPARAGHEGDLLGRAAGAGLEQVGQDLVAQQFGLVGPVQDVRVPCQRGMIVHRRLDEGRQEVKQG